jgi:hypothetical protein
VSLVFYASLSSAYLFTCKVFSGNFLARVDLKRGKVPLFHEKYGNATRCFPSNIAFVSYIEIPIPTYGTYNTLPHIDVKAILHVIETRHDENNIMCIQYLSQ